MKPLFVGDIQALIRGFMATEKGLTGIADTLSNLADNNRPELVELRDKSKSLRAEFLALKDSAGPLIRDGIDGACAGYVDTLGRPQ